MLNWKAVFLGAVADFAGSIFVTIILAQAWIGALQLSGMPVDGAREMTSNSHLLLAISVAIGWYFDYLGGKIAASIAENRGTIHGIVAVLPGVAYGLVQTFTDPSPVVPVWFDAVLCLVSIGFGYYGGGSAKQMKKS